MIIPSKLIKLDYDPSKDILFVEWPDFEYHALSELQRILENIIETIRHYDIKYLLIDSRTAVVTVNDADYKSISNSFVRELASTRVKKVARLITNNLQREIQVKLVQENTGMALKLESFNSVDEALNWFKL